MTKIIAALLTMLVIISCENENESKYKSETTPIDTAITDSLLIGQIASFPFENDISDHSGNAFPLAFSGLIHFKAANKTSFSLFKEMNDYVQFILPASDTLSFTCFLKSEKKVNANGSKILDLNKKAEVGFYADAVTGPTYMAIGTSVKNNLINSYNSWIFLYVEIIKNSGTAKMIIKNIESSDLQTFEYLISLTEPISAGELIRIGANFSLQNGFSGAIDELKLFNRSLSESELEYLYKNQ